MKSRAEISSELQKIDGLVLVNDISSYDRFSGGLSTGSLYVKDNYISATGDFKVLENGIPRTSSDSKDCPEWRDKKVNEVLHAIGGLHF